MPKKVNIEKILKELAKGDLPAQVEVLNEVKKAVLGKISEEKEVLLAKSDELSNLSQKIEQA